jgi:hypothetical protein
MRILFVGSARIALLGLIVIGPAASAFAAGSEADFKAAYAAAEAAEKEAGSLRNQWTATETSLAEARAAAGQGKFDRATTAARQAEALAKASISQAAHEKQAWKDLEIR